MPTYAFVDQIAGSPTIVFDLDNQSPFSVVEGTKTPPPSKRFAKYGSTARDGDHEAASSYNDRVLTIELRVELNTTAEQQVEGIQVLSRLLDAPQWLMWQHEGMIEPVFFRTRRGDVEVDDDILTADSPRRYITLDIGAEPFAYGLPVTGAATINNDPTASSNPMSYVFPDIQGDVASPLSVAFNPSTTPSDGLDEFMLAISSGGSTPLTPRIVQPVKDVGSYGGWTQTNAYADSLAIGGTVLRNVKASGVAVSLAVASVQLPPGEWRLFARVWSNTTDVRVGFAQRSGDFRELTPRSDSFYRWYDAGVFRFPYSYPVASEPQGVAAPLLAPSKLSIRFAISGAAGEVRLDDLLFVPVGLDDAAAASLMLGGGEIDDFPVAPDDWTTTVDGISEQVWVASATKFKTTVRFAGGIPRVLPGHSNVMTLIHAVDDSFADAKADTADFSYRYFPRYLYIRPAAS